MPLEPHASLTDCLKNCILAYNATMATAESTCQTCQANAADTNARRACIAAFAATAAAAANTLADCAENCGI